VLTVVAALVLAPKQTWSQKLPDGSTVNLVAVSNFATKKSWNPDGSRQKTWTAPDTLKQLYNGATSKTLGVVTNFVVQLLPKDPNSMPSVAFKLGDKNLGLGYTLRDQKNPKLWWCGAGTDNRKLPSSVDLKVGIGTGKWTATAMHNLQSGATKGPKFFGNILRNVKYPGVKETLVVVEGTVPKSIAGKVAYRMKMFDVTGTPLAPAGIGPLKAGVPSRWFFIENGQRLVHADLMTQPYKWLTFKTVHTKVK
jgi:hypothetical protein